MSAALHRSAVCALVSLVMLSLGACRVNHYYYHPQANLAPMLTGQGDIVLQGDMAVSGRSSNVEGAYAVTDNLGIIGGYQGERKQGSRSTDNTWTSNYYHGGAGYYTNFSEHGVFETFLDGGIGKRFHSYSEQGVELAFFIPVPTFTARGSATLGFTKMSVQPAVGFVNDYFEVAVALRVTNVNFHLVLNDVDPDYRNAYNEIVAIGNRSSYTFLEPAVTLRTGPKYAKFQFQMGISEQVGGWSLQSVNYYLSAGLQLSIRRKYWGA